MTQDQTRVPATERSPLKAVALPSEHGGWGLTLEPGLLGLLVAPSWAGCCLALAAVGAFLARTPAKIVLVDRWRGRFLPRTRLALKVAVGEAVVILALVVAAAVLATDSLWWVPALVAAPLIAIELWYDMRSRSRRLVPELAGAVGVASIAAMVVLADGGETSLAVGVWAILSARVISSIPWVRSQIFRLHGRPTSGNAPLIGDLVAALVVVAAALARVELVVGAAGVLALIAIQRVVGAGEPRPPKKLGYQQMALGFGLVALTAVGVWVI